ncbi:MAG: hypothetical protein IT322_14515 [Anaerolineae bacterium]|nr:hypothetical protein [Anaerolineae bacterium]CAG0953877.1 hypothetical protein ANRL4_00250 [Anaerolineae bacterium]
MMDMMLVIKPFLGRWVLLADRSEYQLGQPPQEGFYTLEANQTQLKVTMAWVAADGKSFEQTYNAIPDGQDHPYPDNPAVDTISMTVVNETRLDSDAKKNQQVISYAVRQLMDEGRLMKIEMITYLPQGTFTNTAFYARQSDDNR